MNQISSLLTTLTINLIELGFELNVYEHNPNNGTETQIVTYKGISVKLVSLDGLYWISFQKSHIFKEESLSLNIESFNDIIKLFRKCCMDKSILQAIDEYLVKKRKEIIESI